MDEFQDNAPAGWQFTIAVPLTADRVVHHFGLWPAPSRRKREGGCSLKRSRASVRSWRCLPTNSKSSRCSREKCAGYNRATRKRGVAATWRAASRNPNSAPWVAKLVGGDGRP
jgi:hypothetical protein